MRGLMSAAVAPRGRRRVAAALVLCIVLAADHVAAHGQSSNIAARSWKEVVEQLKEATTLQRTGWSSRAHQHSQQQLASQQQQPAFQQQALASGQDADLAASEHAMPVLPDWTDYDASDYEELQRLAGVEAVQQQQLQQPLGEQLAPVQQDMQPLVPPVQDMQLPMELLELPATADAVSLADPAADDLSSGGPAVGSSDGGAAPPQAPAAAAAPEPKQQQQRARARPGALGLLRRNKQGQQQAQPSAVPEQQQQPAAVAVAAQAPTADDALGTALADHKLAGNQQLPPLHVSPPPSLSDTVTVDVDARLLQVPQSFLGLSHEWDHVEELDTNPGYKRAVKLLSSYGSGPLIIRVGGGSTDKITELLPASVYAALARVHKQTGARFILGLNFEAANLSLTQRQMQAAQATLPDEAVLTYELGNEPNFYTSKNMTGLQYSRCCFATEWADFARNLSCPCGSRACCVDGLFAGPAWGYIGVYPSTVKFFLDNAARHVSMVTVHWYKAAKETPNITPASLLDEAPIRAEMQNLKQLVGVANSYGKPLRVAEANTISNSGLLGVSNVFASALWTLDAAFEAAAAGSVGINLHQGAGQNLYTAIVRREIDGVLKPAVLRPSFYGMLLFQQAVRGGSMILKHSHAPSGGETPAAAAAHLKVWPLVDTASGELRFVLLNRHPTQAAMQVVRLEGARGTRAHYSAGAALTRLVAQGDTPLAATDGITLGGRFYSAGCELRGADQVLTLDADARPDDALAWSVYLPPGSATLMEVSPRSIRGIAL